MGFKKLFVYIIGFGAGASLHRAVWYLSNLPVDAT